MRYRLHIARNCGFERPALSFALAALIIFVQSSCVGPDNKPLGGVPIHKQYEIAGTGIGAGIGFGIARAIGANGLLTAALTAGGAYAGHGIGDSVGKNQQEKYDANMARDTMVSRRILSAENAIASAKQANANLRRALKRLRDANRSATAAEIREQNASASKLKAQIAADILSIDEARHRARTLGLHAENKRLEDQRDQLEAQNAMYRQTVSQYNTTGSR